MPDMIPTPSHDPPSRWDHFLAHGPMVVVAAFWSVFGVLMALPAALGSSWSASAVLLVIPAPLAIIAGVALSLAGVATVWAVQTGNNRLSRTSPAAGTGSA